MAEEQIGYIERNDIIFSLPSEKSPFVFASPVFSDTALRFAPKSEVEANTRLIQPIPVAVITNQDASRILAVKKQSKAVAKGSSEDGKTLIYVGGHMSKSDAEEAKDSSFVSICKNTLSREIEEEIGAKLAIDAGSPFYIYAATGNENNQHMAVCFLISVDESSLSLSIDGHELVHSNKSGQFIPIEDLRHEKTLEEWSEAIFEYAFE